MNTSDHEQMAVAKLQALVEKFNLEFDQWRKETGMVAVFSWGYTMDDDEAACKRMELHSVDRIIYRKPPPSAEAFRSRLEAISDADL
jgi:hypothetical protein